MTLERDGFSVKFLPIMQVGKNARYGSNPSLSVNGSFFSKEPQKRKKQAFKMALCSVFRFYFWLVRSVLDGFAPTVSTHASQNHHFIPAFLCFEGMKWDQPP